jgi:hypothetical protein
MRMNWPHNWVIALSLRVVCSIRASKQRDPGTLQGARMGLFWVQFPRRGLYG